MCITDIKAKGLKIIYPNTRLECSQHIWNQILTVRNEISDWTEIRSLWSIDAFYVVECIIHGFNRSTRSYWCRHCKFEIMQSPSSSYESLISKSRSNLCSATLERNGAEKVAWGPLRSRQAYIVLIETASITTAMIRLYGQHGWASGTHGFHWYVVPAFNSLPLFSQISGVQCTSFARVHTYFILVV